MKSTPICLFISLVAAGAIGLAATMLKVGDKAPDVTAPASDGSTVHLKDYIGKGNVVLYFYPKDDTPGCTKEACGVRDTIGELQGLNATVFGVSFDSVESHKKFVEKYKLPFLLLADTDKKVAKAYGIADDNTPVAPRTTFIINKEGKIAFVIPKVDPITHANNVRAMLASMEK